MTIKLCKKRKEKLKIKQTFYYHYPNAIIVSQNLIVTTTVQVFSQFQPVQENSDGSMRCVIGPMIENSAIKECQNKNKHTNTIQT
jgi:hypothetical protein